MMGGRSWPFWIFIALLVVAYFALHLVLGFGPVVPDLLTVAVLLAARRLNGAVAALFGFGAGLLRDSLSVVAFGADAITLTVLGYIGSRSRDLFVGDSLLFVGLYLFVGKWVHDVAYYLIAGSAIRGDAVTRFLVQAPLASVYAAASGALLLLVFRVASGEN